MLCDICTSTLTAVLREPRELDDWAKNFSRSQGYVRHHETYEALQISAQNSCYICTRLLQWVHENHAQWVAHGDPLWMPFIKASWACIERQSYREESVHFNLSGDWDDRTAGNPQRGPLRGDFEVYEFNGPLMGDFELRQVHNTTETPEIDAISPRVRRLRTWWKIQIQRYAKRESEQALRPGYKATSQTTAGADCFSLIRQWLGDCIEHHPNCERLRTSQWYPTRLLDTKNYDSGSVKLLETGACPPDGPYMTLSHCWGGLQTSSLTSNNINDFKRSIPIATLPKTFLEAISATRSLNVRYLWIDSLCIVQDAPDDWADESSRMDQVYRHSLCNIGASSAVNSDGGLFHRRNPDLVNPIQVCCDGKEYSLFPNRIIAINLNLCHLSKRGWVVQERFLCPRMIHFGQDQITWECRAAIACETLPVLSTSDSIAVHLKWEDVDAPSFQLLGVEGKGVAAGRLAPTWHSMLSLYTGADLTYAADKLVAFSGLAKALLAQEPKDQYLAGLWKQDLIPQLAWTIFTLYDHEASGRHNWTRHTEYIAPSWSWASVKGTVNAGIIHYYNVQQIAVFVDHYLEYRTSDSTGQVTFGWISLQGPLREMKASYADPTGSTVRLHTWATFSDAYEGQPSNLCYLSFESGTLGEDWAETLYCLPLFWDFWHPSQNGIVKFYGLLLRQAPGSSGAFIRFGILHCNDYQWTHRLAKPMPIHSLPDLPFDSATGYTIRVI